MYRTKIKKGLAGKWLNTGKAPCTSINAVLIFLTTDFQALKNQSPGPSAFHKCFPSRNQHLFFKNRRFTNIFHEIAVHSKIPMRNGIS